jgi:hypothetical protein
MSDNLARRMADNQTRMATEQLARDASRFAEAASQYAAAVIRGGPYSGGAYQLAQQTADLLRQAARLDGMTDIAGLLPSTDGEAQR